MDTQDFVVNNAEIESFFSSAEVMKSKVRYLLPLKDLAIRSFVSNLSTFMPDQMTCLIGKDELKLEILKKIEENIVRMKAAIKGDCSILTRDRNGRLQLTKDGRSSQKCPAAILERLVNPSLPAFDFLLCGGKDNFFAEDGLDTRILSKLVEENSDSLTSIVDRRGDYNSTAFVGTKGSAIIHELVKFKNLQTLDMATVRFSDDDLKVLSENCTFLKMLTLANFSSVTVKGIKCLRSLLHLEGLRVGSWFGYKDKGSRLKPVNYFIRSFELLPQLKTIDQLEPSSDEPDALFKNYICLTIPPEKRSPIYKLERLNTFLHFSSFEEVPTSLPFLKDITLNFLPKGPYKPSAFSPDTLSKLHNVTEMKLIFCDSFDYGYMAVAGSKLTKLELFGSVIEMDMFRVLLLCPNLKSLMIQGVCKDEFQTTEMDLSKLKLQELHLEKCLNGSGSIVWKLLMAPELHTVCLKNMPSFEYPDALIGSLEPFLQNLSNFEADFEVASANAFSEYLQLMKKILRNCQKLDKFLCKCTTLIEPRRPIILATFGHD